MEAMTGQIAALIVGAMLFFSGVIAPLVFKVLQADDAGRFLRAMFPLYYVVLGVTAVLGAVVAVLAGQSLAAWLFALTAALLLASRFIAVPIINAARDKMLAGDAAAKSRFDLWHRGTVVANLFEIIILAVIMYGAAA
ncbi:MAG: DUF4149 domain-containing protein [Pseudomonadota bacterium]